MAYAIQSPEDKMDAYEEDHWIEAYDCFDRLCKFNAEAICRCVAWAYLEDDEAGIKAWTDLGLTRRHAMIVCGRKDEFWQEIRDNKWMGL